tara:strand:- start:623 stop:2341 length:1719 start_codon:yes stop_codon:yes gene_type:complete
MGGTSSDKKIRKSTLEKVKLGKKVYNNKEFDDVIDRNFSSLIKTQRPISIERFFGVYRELFYKIQKSGEPEDNSSTGDAENKSHWELIRESQDYLNNWIDWRDKIIDALFLELERLNDILIKKQSGETNQHPVYADGTFLRSPARNSNGLPIWVMQNGVKREIENYDTYKSLKKASGREYDDSDDDICQLLEISTLDNILDGPKITKDIDINITVWQSSNLDITLAGITDYRESEITCLEGSDASTFAPTFSSNLPFNEEPYQPRYSSCEIEYTSLDINIPGDSKEISETLFPGDTITIKYRANTDENITSLIIKQGFTQEKVIKDTKRELRNPIKKDAFGNWVDELGNQIYKYYDLPGVPFSQKKQWKSSYGTNKVQQNERISDTSWWLPYKDHGWSDIAEQEIQGRLWEEVFDDSSNVYYDNSTSWNGFQGPLGGLYGLPIYYIPNPMGQDEGHSNMFVVKVGTDSVLLDDPFASYYQYQVQYYIILNKDYESFNHIKRLKTALNQNLSPNVLNQTGGYEGLRNKNIVELTQIAEDLELPKALFTDNWRVHMSNFSRGNQKLVYPGFTNL